MRCRPAHATMTYAQCDVVHEPVCPNFMVLHVASLPCLGQCALYFWSVLGCMSDGTECKHTIHTTMLQPRPYDHVAATSNNALTTPTNSNNTRCTCHHRNTRCTCHHRRTTYSRSPYAHNMRQQLAACSSTAECQNKPLPNVHPAAPEHAYSLHHAGRKPGNQGQPTACLSAKPCTSCKSKSLLYQNQTPLRQRAAYSSPGG